MTQSEKEQLDDFMDFLINEQLRSCVLSNPINKLEMSKVKIRPLLIQNQIVFQAEEFIGNQVFHKNYHQGEIASYIVEQLTQSFKQMDVQSNLGEGHILISKKGKVTIKQKSNVQQTDCMKAVTLSHNRKKQYILEEGKPVGFLIDLGVMTTSGMVIRSRYDKFKQINRFLEFIEDILPKLDPDQENVIIDFGCGKSYLTFAMYYYLKELKQYPIRIIGLDLKQEVIAHCNELRTKYHYDQLDFYHGDIASYEGVDRVDMVVTLHACDTATDFALAKAVKWGAKVILSVPCCQHELNQQISNERLAPILQYGLIKERMAALYTDALRAELLEGQGYRTQILEFISMDHTPKNILIRAVKHREKKDNRQQLDELFEFLQVSPTLVRLLEE